MHYFHLVERRIAKANALKKYFTGKPCKYGHINLRFSSSGLCLSCHELKLKSDRLPLSDSEISERKKRWARESYSRIKQDDKKLTHKRAMNKKWKKENPDKVKKSWSNWRKKESSKAIIFMRDSLRRVLKIEKNGRTEKILGYTRLELKSHIERQFAKGMTWENHGEWHIDHITPISVLLAKGIEDPKVINCLTNLKPVWAKDNLKKNNKVEYLI